MGEKYDPVDHHIKEFAVTPADLKILLDELQSVQSPEPVIPLKIAAIYSTGSLARWC